jgi:hypothetical protein
VGGVRVGWRRCDGRRCERGMPAGSGVPATEAGDCSRTAEGRRLLVAGSPLSVACCWLPAPVRRLPAAGPGEWRVGSEVGWSDGEWSGVVGSEVKWKGGRRCKMRWARGSVQGATIVAHREIWKRAATRHLRSPVTTRYSPAAARYWPLDIRGVHSSMAKPVAWVPSKSGYWKRRVECRRRDPGCSPRLTADHRDSSPIPRWSEGVRISPHRSPSVRVKRGESEMARLRGSGPSIPLICGSSLPQLR